MFAIRRLLAAHAIATLLTACGGGGGASPTPTTPPTGPTEPAPAAVVLTANASSAHHASLAWPAVAGASGYVVQRASTGAAFATVAELPAEATSWVDSGLNANSAYTYRVAARGGVASAERVVTTTGDLPLTTPVGEVGAELARATVGAAGGRISADNGSVIVDVPAGAFTTATEIVLRAQTNTVPGAAGDGVQLEMASTPAKPLAVTLRHAESETGNAAGLAVAVQQADGSWLALPATTEPDKPMLSAKLPMASVSAPAPAQLQASASVKQSVGAVKALWLDPSDTVLWVTESERFVPKARVLQAVSGACDDVTPAEDDLCIPTPGTVLEPRTLAFTNTKAGYTREWRVQGQAGGTTALGTVQPDGNIGAIYTAPAHKPSPSTVTVSFVSRHNKSGRSIELKAKALVMEPVWTGTIVGLLDGTTDIGFEMTIEGVWTVEKMENSVASLRATGTQSLRVINVVCTATASPSRVTLPPGLLTVDIRNETYSLDAGSLWNTAITGVCPDGTGTAGMEVPGHFETTGALPTDGRLQGSAHMNHITWTWDLKLQF